MCETVLEYFKSIHVARDIRDYVNWWNERTLEYVFRDEDYDSEDEWRKRDTWDVCCISKLVDGEGDGESKPPFDRYGYSPSGDDDVSIPEIALRIVTEDGWKRA